MKEVLLVIGALGTVPLQMSENLKLVGMRTSIELIQKSVWLGTVRTYEKNASFATCR